MRDMTPMERKGPKEIDIQVSESVKQVLNIIDHMIAGKRFGELDSAKQMYLLDCQAKIEEMKDGYFTEAGATFLINSIGELLNVLNDAQKDLRSVVDKLYN